MSLQMTQEIFTQLNEAANQFTQTIFSHTKSERGIHLETAITAPCFLAGNLILRSTGIDFSQLAPGQPVFVNLEGEHGEDIVNDTGRQILDFMQKVSATIGLNPLTGWSNPVPEEHRSLEPGIDLVKKIEKPFHTLMDQFSVPKEYYPYVAAFTGMIIINMGAQTLNPDISKAIALSALVAGCKTIPYT